MISTASSSRVYLPLSNASPEPRYSWSHEALTFSGRIFTSTVYLVPMFQSISGLSVPRVIVKISLPRLHLSSRSSSSSSISQGSAMRGLTVEALNPSILNVQYAVRGELAIKAEEYRVRLKAGATDLPFDKVISSNIGNPQQTGLDQPPITFNRQVGGWGPANCKPFLAWQL